MDHRLWMFNKHYETGADLKPEFIDGCVSGGKGRTNFCLEGIGWSRQAEALDGVKIVAMSDHIAKLTAALAESERRRVAEQESMSETVQQIKEQVMNLARRPTTSAPDDTDDESDEDDYIDLTP
ncbi:hypothetical protein MTR67_047676 [Solanum verrucosum]|uniref:Uncharacterized protein n=1 Tax=Solanum verrucosum TaxID=315347 RepID=A0AAF0UZU1_SOLVR|nr:hypothetical protein MTR67_047676 [Solanum verrucosum]